MAKTILVNPTTLSEQSNQIRQYKETHKDIMTKITNLVMNIGEAWQGEAQNAFVSKFVSMQPVHNSFEDALEEFSDLMDKVSEEMKKTDELGKSRINSI